MLLKINNNYILIELNNINRNLYYKCIIFKKMIFFYENIGNLYTFIKSII